VIAQPPENANRIPTPREGRDYYCVDNAAPCGGEEIANKNRERLQRVNRSQVIILFKKRRTKNETKIKNVIIPFFIRDDCHFLWNNVTRERND
jgi:hypothetical protein